MVKWGPLPSGRSQSLMFVLKACSARDDPFMLHAVLNATQFVGLKLQCI